MIALTDIREKTADSECSCGGSVPKLAILAWEEGKVPRGLLQLETLKGKHQSRLSIFRCWWKGYQEHAPKQSSRSRPGGNAEDDRQGVGAPIDGCKVHHHGRRFNAIFRKRYRQL